MNGRACGLYMRSRVAVGLLDAVGFVGGDAKHSVSDGFTAHMKEDHELYMDA